MPRNGPPIVAERAHDIYGNYPFIVTNMTQEKGEGMDGWSGLWSALDL